MKMPLHRFALLCGALSTGAIVGWSCSAEDAIAPRAETEANIQACGSFETLMPKFLKAIRSGKTENLRKVVEEQLYATQRENEVPPINLALRAVFLTLQKLARKPAEAGAPSGEYCAPSSMPPEVADANEICELRRAIEVLVHDGKGIDAITLLEPLLLGVLDYVNGAGKDGQQHYEVSAALASMCSQSTSCQLSNGLDLVIVISEYLRTADGKKLVDDLATTAENSNVIATFDDMALSENEFVAVLQVLLDVLPSADAAGIETAYSSLRPSAETERDFRPLIDDLKVLVGHEEVMGPVRKALACLQFADPPVTASGGGSHILRMLYRLAIRDDLEAFGLVKLAQTLRSFQQIDQRQAFLVLLESLARAVRTEDAAIDATAKVCKTLFTTVPAPGQTRGNATLVLPVLSVLLRDGLIPELMCTIDSLLFGCSGGAQPACGK